MPRNADIPTQAGQWTLLNDGPIASLSFQNQGAKGLKITATEGATPPAADAAGPRFAPGLGQSNMVLAEVFLHLSAPDHAWAWTAERGECWVSHA